MFIFAEPPSSEFIESSLAQSDEYLSNCLEVSDVSGIAMYSKSILPLLEDGVTFINPRKVGNICQGDF